MKRKKSEDGPRRSDIWEDDEVLEGVLGSILDLLLSGGISTKEQLQKEKLKFMKSKGLDDLPTNSMILHYLRSIEPDREKEFISILKKKPSRTLSGVAVVAVMTSPHECPHGKCLFCPGGVEQEIPTPQSYTGREPAAMRASGNNFDPYEQVANRIGQLEEIGHPTDKIDLILMGGTITAREEDYQIGFVKGCLDAMNGERSSTFEEAARLNETSIHRCVGTTFETRPDRSGKKETDLILDLGGTRVELGVQSVFDEPLTISRRGHSSQDTIDATRIAKDSGLKVGYHLMPGIPGSTPMMDLESARKVFQDPDFKPDMIKIYPTLVIGGTDLYDMWKKGEYTALTTEDASKLVAEIKRITPPWVRIQRVQRDIPSPLVEGGVKKSNLRQLAQIELHRMGFECRCVRCREIGHKLGTEGVLPQPEDITLVRREYDASGGKEVFLSFEVEAKDALVGYVRLRLPSDKAHRDEIGQVGLVRELKVFGPMVPIGKDALGEWQHRGYGSKLMMYAGSIVKDEWGLDRIIVISGIGAREYYKKFGFERYGPYMGKGL